MEEKEGKRRGGGTSPRSTATRKMPLGHWCGSTANMPLTSSSVAPYEYSNIISISGRNESRSRGQAQGRGAQLELGESFQGRVEKDLSAPRMKIPRRIKYTKYCILQIVWQMVEDGGGRGRGGNGDRYLAQGSRRRCERRQDRHTSHSHSTAPRDRTHSDALALASSRPSLLTLSARSDCWKMGQLDLVDSDISRSSEVIILS